MHASWKLVAFTTNLIAGLVLAQLAGLFLNEDSHYIFHEVVLFITMWALSYIMINVGYEFTVDKAALSYYVWDYLIAMTAAGFPWLFVAGWYLLTIPGMVLSEAFVVARFAAPTSAGILFSMLEAAGLRNTWVFSKARILAIFDDLDTILLMIPLKVLLIGFKWDLLAVVGIMTVLLTVAWVWLHALKLPHNWKWTLFYAAVTAAMCKLVHYVTHHYTTMEPIHIEVLLPAFVIGCIIDTPCARVELALQRRSTKELQERQASKQSITSVGNKSGEAVSECSTTPAGTTAEPGETASSPGQNASMQLGGDDATVPAKSLLPPDVEAGAKMEPDEEVPEPYTPEPCSPIRQESAATSASKHSRLSRHGAHLEHEEDPVEHAVNTVISMAFMVLVGLSMPSLVGKPGDEEEDVETLDASLVVMHVIVVTLLMTLGKMFPSVCYRQEAPLKSRLALCMGMCPRGEVGASIIVISLELGVSGPAVTISMLALVINLVLSGGFIGSVKLLLRDRSAARATEMEEPERI
eukprot:TRINITY_DN1309_c0_g1_i1.p1 TRINITY_DN1309_c0_g1~~TRINITY_DN1309_c0_g1_i1.p1  ORF type:complete len:523 (-),score=85.81 TRINITY_DN1309_c0_g1_i1:365-1933(-)